MKRSACVQWTGAVVLLLLAVLAVDAAPQAVVMGRRPTGEMPPVVIEDEEVLGEPMDRNLEPLKPAVPDDDAGMRAADTAPGDSGGGLLVTNTSVEVTQPDGSVVKKPVMQVKDAETGKVLAETNPQQAEAGDDGEEKKKEGLALWVIVLVVVLVLILLAVLIWAMIRHRKKKALRAQGLNAEVTSVTPVITPDGKAANVVSMEPLSAPTTGTPTAGA